jgi:predicted MFS family arabinose efflux permease
LSAQKKISLFTATTFAFYVGGEMIAPIFPLYALDVGATLVEVGLLLSVLSFVTMMVMIPFGTAGRSLGAERLMLVSCSLYVASLVLYYLASSVWWMLIAVVLNGLATGSFGPLAASTVLNLADPETRGDVSGKYYSSIGLAMFVGPFITSVLIRFLDYRLFFLTVLFFPISCILPVLKLKSNSDDERYRVNTKHGFETGKNRTMNEIVRLLLQRIVLVLLVITFLFSVCEGWFRTLFPVYGQRELLFSASAISVLFAFFGGVNALTRIPSGRLSDIIGRKKPLLLSLFMYVVAFTIFAQIGQFSLLVIGMIVYGAASGLRVPPSSALLADNIESRGLPVVVAFLWMAADLGLAVGAGTAGYMGTMLSFPTIIQSTVAILLVCVGLALVGFQRIR